ncbi:peroxisomal membrane protein PMP34 [Conger conger]|uniref:peroxisomal membrane protein PMP34 n=1 Tax=Conger conger TaxID=82655 RepID=UPI002A5B0447|nr:peroxisomal membrane protein PMP34 [Conger conger]XP_061080277.1 peroxisomal membrane protein PMP34 [Conger conger]
MDSEKLSAVFSYESLVHAVAGAMGSVTAMTVFFPLDTARLRLQVDEKRKAKSTPAILAEIIKEEGFLAPYRGWFPVICSLCCSNFVYFYCFHSLKTTWLRGQRSTPGRDLLIGIAAGVVNVLVTTPLWVVNTRLKLQGAKFRNADIRPTYYTGIVDAFSKIVGEEGAGALWNGTFPSLLLVMNPAVQFMIYEGLKRQLSKGVHRELSSLEVFFIGAVAKAIATTVTYPLQTVQSILRFGQHRQPTERSRLLSCLRNVVFLLLNRVRKNGILGLFKGLEAKLLQTVLTAALMFLLYEKIVSSTFRVMGVRRPSPGR